MYADPQKALKKITTDQFWWKPLSQWDLEYGDYILIWGLRPRKKGGPVYDTKLLGVSGISSLLLLPGSYLPGSNRPVENCIP